MAHDSPVHPINTRARILTLPFFVHFRGDVRIFKSGEHAGQWLFSHKLALKESQGYAVGSPSDRILSLAWNSDGSALAVGQESRCPSVWSVYGRRLFPSASHDIPAL